VSIHALGIIGLVAIFVAGALRPVNLGVLALAMTFLLGTIVIGESARSMLAGFPVDLLVLLVGVTYLFGIAESNGSVARLVGGAARLAQGHRALIPWIVFAVASLPAMAGALGSAGVAMLAPISLRLAERYDIDRRMIGLMVVHGAAAGNFSPLNVLGAIVLQAAARSGFPMSPIPLFVANLAFNMVLAMAIFVVYGGFRLVRAPETGGGAASVAHAEPFGDGGPSRGRPLDQISTLLALTAVAVGAFRFGLDIGLVALTAAVLLHLCFPASSAGAEKRIAWSVALLVCGIVTYVAALQRYGTVEAVGGRITALGSPSLTAFLVCAVAAVTSAFASSAGILGSMIPLAGPLLVRGDIGPTGLVIAIALSATLVDATPFSTVGALVVANASADEQRRVYRGLLAWGAVMVLTAPVVTWLVFILPS
jgi:di/tricarboxylate transporter